MPVQTAIQLRRGTAASWTSTNPTLAAGEVGFETDTGKFKIGTGSAAWNSLTYFNPGAVASPLTTKGDLWTYSTTNARLATGTDGETLVADSAASTGLRWQSVNTGNFVVNGLFDFWQRGTSGTYTGTVTYPAADRWFAVCTGTAPTCTMSRQTADTTNLQYGLRFGRNSGQTNTGSPYVGTVLETATTKLLAGQTITVSLYIKKGADAPTNITVGLYTGTGTDQSAAGLFSGSWTSGAYAFNTAQATTTTMTRYSFTTTLGSTISQIALLCSYTPSGTAGANEWFQIEGVQIEVGFVPTAVRRSGGTLAGELVSCQRFYEKSYDVNVTPGTSTTEGQIWSTGNLAATTGTIATGAKFCVTKRGTPTITFYDDAGNLNKCTRQQWGVGGDVNQAITAFQIGQNGFLAQSSGTANKNAISFHFVASAEL